MTWMDPTLLRRTGAGRRQAGLTGTNRGTLPGQPGNSLRRRIRQPDGKYYAHPGTPIFANYAVFRTMARFAKKTVLANKRTPPVKSTV